MKAIVIRRYRIDFEASEFEVTVALRERRDVTAAEFESIACWKGRLNQLNLNLRFK